MGFGAKVTQESVEAALGISGALQGETIYRAAAVWALLAPGTSGDFLKTLGDDANPEWDAVAGIGLRSKLVWLDPSQNALSLNNQTSGSGGYVERDLSAYVSEDTIAVILEMYIKIDSIEDGAWVDLAVTQANEATVGLLRIARQYADGVRAGGFSYEQGIAAVDENQRIDYMTRISGTAQVDFNINLLGYIENI